jgi:nicotinate-nucleotide adenylyltransferase
MGILGGMFNPPHLGHIELARVAATQLNLDRVFLTPVLVPPHKPAKWDPGAEQRLCMCRLAAQHDPLVDVCTLELERPGPSYTVDTLRAIHANQPDAELTLILGADMAITLGSWREPREILKLARLAVAEREEVNRHAVLDALAPLADAERVAFLDMTPHHISSSDVRRRLTSGEDIEELVGGDVAAHIAENELYDRRPVPQTQETGR